MFIVGAEYPRKALLEFTGSKQAQTGIVWGPKQPECLIVTSGGRHSKLAGYSDEILQDGTLTYFGQGKKGDQNPKTFANSLLVNGARDVMVFSTREPNAKQVKLQGDYSKRYRFEGMFNVYSWEWYTPTIGTRAGNKLLKFKLLPVDVASLHGWETTEVISKEPVNLHTLRNYLQHEGGRVKKSLSLVEYSLRSRKIKIYALTRAAGYCEGCGNQAPFLTVIGEPYLEVHHLHRLSDDGPDIPSNVIALCPNCHRSAHYGKEKDKTKLNLIDIVACREDEIARK